MPKLIIVESPAKAKTIKKYLGKGYEVIASMGHIRDLPKSKIGVDIENHFEPQYINIKGKGPLIKELKKVASKCDTVFLATDPDREGEAISWHLAYLLDQDVSNKTRVVFNEITKSGVKEGMKHPRAIDLDLVDAQQARRVLDRIVGYKLSPFLWKKVRPGLSAGRVQSVAVKIIVDREEEIRAFVPEEYWSIEAKLSKQGKAKTFTASFYGDGKKKIKLTGAEQTKEILEGLKGAAYAPSDIKKGVRQKTPAPPFITSTLQQEASRRLNFQSRRTMRAAQDLYEGLDVGKQGTMGLITYMRTDSLRISDEARTQASAFITERWGQNYLPEKPRFYKSRASAQDAHEAVRPTIPSLTPEEVKAFVTPDQYKVYKLIWERFIASQMASCIQDTVKLDITAAGYLFKASGYTVRFDGYTVLYEEATDEEKKEGGALPELSVGEPLDLKALDDNQHFTQPPPRYTEASLIRILEEKGIGRPSTYAPTITTILAREYIERDGKSLKPTVLGEVITKLMKEYFTDIVDIQFTANMENKLDGVEQGQSRWKEILEEFYGPFEKTLQSAETQMDGTRVVIPPEETDEICELCGKNMVIKTGRFGKFLACPGYPECKNTKKIVKPTGGVCLGCGGKMLEKKSKKGKIYYGCENNPSCDFMTWDLPVKTVCPQCGKTLFQKKGRGAKTYCANPGCGYEKAAEK